MHEFSIAEKLVEIVKQTVQTPDLEKVSFIKIKIGKMSNVLPEALKSAYNMLVENTSLNKSYLTLEISPMVLKCNECGFTETINDFVFNCSKCTSSNLTIKGGDELQVSEITLN
jgi:hydrogenase nickel incorporation protein HypA/HybF